MRTWDKRRQEYKEMKTYYYHLSSDGWKEGFLFHTHEQYAYGMTLMGLLSLRYGIVIYDFSLMPNHIHILLKGSGEQCVNAFDYFRKRLSVRLLRDSYPALPEDYGFKLKPVETEEQMRINYLSIDRNAYEINSSVSGGYPWGSAYLHFSEWDKYLHGVGAEQFSKRELERLTGTRTPIPASWEFHPELGLLPVCFVDLSLFKRLFSSPKDYATRLIKEYEAFVKLSRSLDEKLVFSPEEVKDIMNHLIRNIFPGKQTRSLTNDEKGRLCVILFKDYDMSPELIAEAMHLPGYLVKQFLYAKDYGKIRRS